MNWLRVLLEIIWRLLLVVAGFAATAAMFAVTNLGRILRQLLPAIFSILPDEYRRIIHLASGIPAMLPMIWAHFKPVRESCSSCAA